MLNELLKEKIFSYEDESSPYVIIGCKQKGTIIVYKKDKSNISLEDSIPDLESTISTYIHAFINNLEITEITKELSEDKKYITITINCKEEKKKRTSLVKKLLKPKSNSYYI